MDRNIGLMTMAEETLKSELNAKGIKLKEDGYFDVNDTKTSKLKEKADLYNRIHSYSVNDFDASESELSDLWKRIEDAGYAPKSMPGSNVIPNSLPDPNFSTSDFAAEVLMDSVGLDSSDLADDDEISLDLGDLNSNISDDEEVSLDLDNLSVQEMGAEYNNLKKREESLSEEEKSELSHRENILKEALKNEAKDLTTEELEKTLDRNKFSVPFSKLLTEAYRNELEERKEKETKEVKENKKEVNAAKEEKKKKKSEDMPGVLSCLFHQADRRLYNGISDYLDMRKFGIPLRVTGFGIACIAIALFGAGGLAGLAGTVYATLAGVGAVVSVLGTAACFARGLGITEKISKKMGTKNILEGGWFKNLSAALSRSKEKKAMKEKNKSKDNKKSAVESKKTNDVVNKKNNDKEFTLIKQFTNAVKNLKIDDIDKGQLSWCITKYKQLEEQGLLEQVDSSVLNRYKEILNNLSLENKKEQKVVVRHIEVLLNELKGFKFENTRENLAKADELLQKINHRESIVESIKNNYSEGYEIYLKFKNDVEIRKSMYEYIDVINTLKPTKLSYEEFKSIIDAGNKLTEIDSMRKIFKEITKDNDEFKNNYARFMRYSRKFMLEKRLEKLEVKEADLTGNYQDVDKVVKMAQGYENKRQEEMHRKEKPIIGQKRLEDMISSEGLKKLNDAKEIYGQNISDFKLICSLVVDGDGNVIVNYNDYNGNKHSVTLTDTIYSGDITSNELVKASSEEISKKAFIPIEKVLVVNCNTDLYFKNNYGSSNKSR